MKKAKILFFVKLLILLFVSFSINAMEESVVTSPSSIQVDEVKYCKKRAAQEEAKAKPALKRIKQDSQEKPSLPEKIMYIVFSGADKTGAGTRIIDLLKEENLSRIFILEYDAFKEYRLQYQKIIKNFNQNWVAFQSKDNAFLIFVPKKLHDAGISLEHLGLNSKNLSQVNPISIDGTVRRKRATKILQSWKDILIKSEKLKKYLCIFGHGGPFEDDLFIICLSPSEYREYLDLLIGWGGLETLFLTSCFCGGYIKTISYCDGSMVQKILPFDVIHFNPSDIATTIFKKNLSKFIHLLEQSDNKHILLQNLSKAFKKDQFKFLHLMSYPLIRKSGMDHFEHFRFDGAFGKRVTILEESFENGNRSYIEDVLIINGMFFKNEVVFKNFDITMKEKALSSIPSASFSVFQNVIDEDLEICKFFENDIERKKAFNCSFASKFNKIYFVSSLVNTKTKKIDRHIIVDAQRLNLIKNCKSNEFSILNFGKIAAVYRFWWEAQPLPGAVPGYNQSEALEKFNQMFWGDQRDQVTDLYSKIFASVAKEDFEVFEKWWPKFEKTADLEVFSELLSHAVSYNNVEFMKRLLLIEKVRLSINTKNNSSYTPLNFAVYKDKKDKALLLIDSGSLFIPDNDGNTPIHIAIKMRMIKDLMEHKIELDRAIVNAKNYKGQTPLHWAILSRNESVVKFLMENGAEFLPDSFGDNPIHYNVIRGSKKTLQYLLSTAVGKAAINEKNKKGYTPLELLIRRKNDEGVCSDPSKFRFKTLELMINSIDNVDDFNRISNKIFELGVSLNDLELIEFLLKLEKINAFIAKEEKLFGPQVLAIEKRYYGVVKLFLDKGFYALDAKSNYFLRRAIEEEGDVEIAKLYFPSEGVKKIDSYDLLTKYFNIEKLDQNILKVLIDLGIGLKSDKESILHIAVRTGNVDLIKNLLSFEKVKKMINLRNSNGSTPLTVLRAVCPKNRDKIEAIINANGGVQWW